MLIETKTIKENCLNEIKREWLAAKRSFPVFLTEISKETKEQNEQYIQSFSEEFKKHFKKFSSSPIGRKKWKQKTFELIEKVLYKETILGIHDSLDHQTIDAFQEDIKDFLRHVRAFAPELSLEGIGQAIRNYIVYAMFNEVNQIKPGFSKAGYGYSMLYPFTDNYIDSQTYSDKEKLEYNQIIRDKIEGKNVNPTSVHQRKTCELLQAIEEDYPRNQDTTIYTLLLMMLEAQEDSMQQDVKSVLSAEERLNISLYKGGISVLIDRYLVRKQLTPADLIFYFGFGFFLQLADDLQDIKDDSIQGHQTLFTINLQPEQEEKLVNQLLNFLHQIMNTYQAENDIFKNFILSNCYQLIYSSVVGSKEFFSKEYIDHLEKLLPITYSFLENMKLSQVKNKDSKIQNKYMKMLDELIS